MKKTHIRWNNDVNKIYFIIESKQTIIIIELPYFAQDGLINSYFYPHNYLLAI
jgi:hypothetical protein